MDVQFYWTGAFTFRICWNSLYWTCFAKFSSLRMNKFMLGYWLRWQWIDEHNSISLSFSCLNTQKLWWRLNGEDDQRLCFSVSNQLHLSANESVTIGFFLVGYTFSDSVSFTWLISTVYARLWIHGSTMSFKWIRSIASCFFLIAHFYFLFFF